MELAVTALVEMPKNGAVPFAIRCLSRLCVAILSANKAEVPFSLSGCYVFERLQALQMPRVG